MNIQYLISIVLITLNISAHAEVFKCQSNSGKTVYQSEPCGSSSQKQRILKVEQMTPEQREIANAKLRDWRGQQAVEESAKAAAAKEQQLERERQEALALQRRSVYAQEQQARAAAQQQNQYRPGFGYAPYYPYYQPWSQAYRYPQSPYDYPYTRFPSSPSQFNPPNSSQMNPPNRPYMNPPSSSQFNPPTESHPWSGRPLQMTPAPQNNQSSPPFLSPGR